MVQRGGLGLVGVLIALFTTAFGGSAFAQEGLRARWEALRVLEAQLDGHWARDESHGQTAVILARRLAESAPVDEVRERLAVLLARQDEYEAYTQAMTRFYIDATEAAVTRAAAGDGALAREAAAVTEAAARYRASEGLYGQPKDFLRLDAAQDLFRAARRFFSQRAAIRARAMGLPAGRSNEGAEGFSADGAHVSMAERVATLWPEALRFAGELVLNRKPGESGEIPFTGALLESIRALGEMDGMTFDVQGRAVLDAIEARRAAGLDSRTVTFLTPVHRGRPHDHFVLAQIGSDRLVIFGAVDHVVRKLPFIGERVSEVIGDLLDRSHTFIAVGRGAGRPVAEALDMVTTRGTRDFALFPEGIIHFGFLDTLPPRQKFWTGLVSDLRQRGYRVDIVPVTNVDSGQVLWQSPTGAQRHQRVVVDEPLTDEMRDRLQAAAGGNAAALSTLLRGLWLERLPTDDGRLLGLARLGDGISALHRYLFSGTVGQGCALYLLPPAP